MAWDAGTFRTPYLAGAWNGKLVMLGETLRLLDARTGREVAKRPVRLPPLPLATIADDRLHVHGIGQELAFDLRTLQPAPPLLDQASGATDSLCQAGRGPVDLTPAAWLPAWNAQRNRAGARRGNADLAASLRVQETDGETLEFSLEVTDDYWEPYRDGRRGDGVTVWLGGVVFSLGMDESGRAVVSRLNVEPPGGAPAGATPAGPPVSAASVRITSTSGLRYAFSVPGWTKRLEYWNDKAAGADTLSLRIALHDDDGEGVKGTLEWGAGRGRLTVRRDQTAARQPGRPARGQ